MVHNCALIVNIAALFGFTFFFAFFANTTLHIATHIAWAAKNKVANAFAHALAKAIKNMPFGYLFFLTICSALPY